MIVCSCNALNEKAVMKAVESGASNWIMVHWYYQRRPQCGKCCETIEKMLEDHVAEISSS